MAGEALSDEARDFNNPDLAQLYNVLQRGAIAGALQIIADSLYITNNRVSVLKFVSVAGGNDASDLFKTWNDDPANADKAVIGFVFDPQVDTGLSIITIRYLGDKDPA